MDLIGYVIVCRYCKDLYTNTYKSLNPMKFAEF